MNSFLSNSKLCKSDCPKEDLAESKVKYKEGDKVVAYVKKVKEHIPFFSFPFFIKVSKEPPGADASYQTLEH